MSLWASHVPEVVHVQEVEGALTATKLTGDPFVPAGEVCARIT